MFIPVWECVSVIGYSNHVWIAQKFLCKIPKKHQIDSGPVSSCMSTKNSSQEITKSKDASYPLHYAGKSLKPNSVHRKDFMLLVIVLFFNKVLELNSVLIQSFVLDSLRNKWHTNTNINITLIKKYWFELVKSMPEKIKAVIKAWWGATKF